MNFLWILNALVLFAPVAPSFGATLKWDANVETEVAGYKVYIGSQSRQYDAILDVGSATQTPLASLLPGQSYYFVVTAYLADGLESDFSEEVSYAVSARTTATPLVPVTACAGSTGSFATTAGGVGPFGFVWRKNGVVINGANKTNLTLRNVRAADAGLYAVEVRGAYNAVTNSALLIVNGSIAATPLTNATVYGGDRATFSTLVSGTSLVVFTWKKDGNTIAGATNTILTLENARPTTAGLYTVEVSGSCNTVTNAAWLVVRLNEATAVPVAASLTVQNAASPVAIVFLSDAGRQYVVQVSEDLRSWQTVQAITSLTNGTNQWMDAEAPGHSKRFYRVLGSQL